MKKPRPAAEEPQPRKIIRADKAPTCVDEKADSSAAVSSLASAAVSANNCVVVRAAN